MLFVCQVLIMIVNWFHLDFNSVKSSVYSATYQKINIRYLKFARPTCFCHVLFYCFFKQCVTFNVMPEF